MKDTKFCWAYSMPRKDGNNPATCPFIEIFNQRRASAVKRIVWKKDRCGYLGCYRNRVYFRLDHIHPASGERSQYWTLWCVPPCPTVPRWERFDKLRVAKEYAEECLFEMLNLKN